MVNDKMVNKTIVAIDGYSSCGKSTIAKALAKHAGYTYVDTGAMYRAIALYTLLNGLEDEAAIIAALPDIKVGFVLVNGAQHATLNGKDVEAQIRTLEVGNRASRISQIKEVRAFLVAQQQAMGTEKGIVMDITSPHYMVVEHSPWLSTWFEDPGVIRIPVEEFDTRKLSFTYGDSMPTFSPRIKDGKEYRKKVYTYEEILDVIARYGLPQDWNDDGAHGPERYIEVQVWCDDPVKRYM